MKELDPEGRKFDLGVSPPQMASLFLLQFFWLVISFLLKPHDEVPTPPSGGLASYGQTHSKRERQPPGRRPAPMKDFGFRRLHRLANFTTGESSAAAQCRGRCCAASGTRWTARWTSTSTCTRWTAACGWRWHGRRPSTWKVCDAPDEVAWAAVL